MDNSRFESKLDKISDKITSIDITLAKQEEQLRLHIKRTNILEEKLEPVEKHVAMVHGGLKIIGLIGIVIGIIEGSIKIMGK